MTRDEANRIYNSFIRAFPNVGGETALLVRLLENSLERQIPKKPTNIESWMFDRLKFGNCRTCDTIVNSNMNYCNDCGQALDWSEEVNENE